MTPLFSSESELRSIIPDAAYKRGRELVLADKLHDVEFHGELLDRVTAICGGSNPGDSYDVTIIVDPNASEKPICTCNCPAGKGKMCKHTVALLLVRAKELNKGASGSGNDEELEFRENEEEVEDADKEWVSMPEKVVPDPTARRVLPNWMTEAPPEKAKKGRASKKQKVDEEGEEMAAKKSPAKRKSKPPAAEDEADKPITQRKRAPSKKNGDNGAAARKSKPPAAAAAAAARRSRVSEVDEVRSSRAKNKRQGDDDDEEQQQQPQRKMQKKQQEQQVVGDESTSSGDGDGMDLTTDDLLSIAQQHLRSPEGETRATAAAVASAVAPPMESPLTKKRKDDSIFSTSSWRSTGISGNALSRDNGGGGSSSAQRELIPPPVAAVPPPPVVPAKVSTDSLANDMFDLMFGPNFAKATAPSAAPVVIAGNERAQLTTPVDIAAAVSTERPVLDLKSSVSSSDNGDVNVGSSALSSGMVSLGICSGSTSGTNTSSNVTSSTMQPKPKKKSSLRDQIGSLLS